MCLPLLASTLILLNNQKVLLCLRSSNMSFLPNMYVFPGGAIAGCDYPSVFHSSFPVSIRSFLEPVSTRNGVIRELFEETGILLACPEKGSWKKERLEEWTKEKTRARKEAADNALSFYVLMKQMSLRLLQGRLYPWARWITPKGESKRFDTWFYCAQVELEEESIVADKVKFCVVQWSMKTETESCLWISPADALLLNEKGAMPLAPPTFYVLKQLAELGSNENILEAAKRKQKADFVPFCPTVKRMGSDLLFLLPGDPEYVPDAEQATWLQPFAGCARLFEKHRIIRRGDSYSLQMQHKAQHSNR